MKHHDQALLLLKKASQDEDLLDKVGRSERISDEIIGFHCQQSIEKCLKAVLSENQITYRRTHDLQELLQLLIHNGIRFPEAILDVDELSPYAVEFRYDVLPEEKERPLDRREAMRLVSKVRNWACNIVLHKTGE
jgi:HEPN domain-containing protein